MKNIKTIFMGTPQICLPTLKFLHEKTNLILIVTQPDKKVGRKGEVEYSAVKKYALEHNIPLVQPSNIKKEFDALTSLKPDIIVTLAYGQIVPKEVLDSPLHGCVNLHGSLLPLYRGAAPIQWALLNGDKLTGMTLMYMDTKMDTGNMIDKKEVTIDQEDNYETLANKLSLISKELIESNIEYLVSGNVNSQVQDEETATYARMLTREDELINFNKDGNSIINQIRGVYPNAYFVFNNQNIKVLKAHFVPSKENITNIIKVLEKDKIGITVPDGIIYLDIVKPAGKNEMNINSYLNGLDKKKYINYKLGV